MRSGSAIISIAAWVAGCQQGREDVLSLARVLAPHATQADDGPSG
jgi:hypothetical protein